jgi:hypothetical protein
MLTVLGKFACAAGTIKYRLDRRWGRRDMTVEYKIAPPGLAAEPNKIGGR